MKNLLLADFDKNNVIHFFIFMQLQLWEWKVLK